MEPGLTASIVSPATATAGDAFTTVDELERGLRDQRYVAERGLATTLFLTLKLGKPLLLEGEAGVGDLRVGLPASNALSAHRRSDRWREPAGSPPRSLLGGVPPQATAAAGDR